MREASRLEKHRFELILLALTVTICAFTAGYYIGRNSSSASRLVESGATVFLEEDAAAEPKEDPAEDPQPAAPPEPSTTSEKKLNLNTATAEQLATLPGIGETLAQRIIAYREEYGEFVSIEELESVRGIGQKTLENLREFVTVGE